MSFQTVFSFVFKQRLVNDQTQKFTYSGNICVHWSHWSNVEYESFESLNYVVLMLTWTLPFVACVDISDLTTNVTMNISITLTMNKTNKTRTKKMRSTHYMHLNIPINSLTLTLPSVPSQLHPEL